DGQRQRVGNPQRGQGDPGHDPAHQADGQPADHVGADLVDHDVDHGAVPGPPVDGEEADHAPAEPGQVEQEVDGEHQHGQHRDQAAEDPAGEPEGAAGQAPRQLADHAFQALAEVVASVEVLIAT